MTTQFLYGIDPQSLEPMKYYDALEYKLLKGKELYKSLYLGETPNENHRMFYTEKALKHTRKLLAERIT